ncbi:unnamed protein product [Lymnaea stagnalis]|uniref:Monocarboxylate transporter n=1 Tax=Lymnaea stagnalis TaxID=6523 RepID=A0AAV2IMW8_LYMST
MKDSEKFEARALVKEYATSDVTYLSDGVEHNNDVIYIANGHSSDIKKPLDEDISHRHTDNSKTNKYKLITLAVADENINETRILKSNCGVGSTVGDLKELKLIEINLASKCHSRMDHAEYHPGTRTDSRNEAQVLGMTESSKLKTDQTKTSSVPFCGLDASLYQEKTLNRNGETNFQSKLFADVRADLGALVKSKEDAKIGCDEITTDESFFAKGLKVIRSALDFSLLRNYLAILYLFTFGLHHSSVFLATYVPSYAVKVGVSQQNAAILLTIVGTCDGASRVAYGFFADLRLVRPSRVLAGLYMFLGLVCQFTSQFTTLGGLVFLAVSYGCCGLSHLSLNAPLIVDFLGVEHLGKVFALGALTSSVFISVQFPVHGVLIEATDSFVASFHWIGATFILSSLCLLSEPVVRRLETKRAK